MKNHNVVVIGAAETTNLGKKLIKTIFRRFFIGI